MKHDSIRWPSELPAHVKQSLLSAAHIVALKDGEGFVLGRDVSNMLIHVLCGSIIGGTIAFQKPMPLLFMQAGSWFGSTSIIRRPNFEYQFTGVDHAKIMQIPGDAVLSRAATHPEIYKLLYVISAENTDAIEAFLCTSAMTLPQKVAYFLLKSSRRFPNVSGAAPMLTLSQGMAARVVGLSRPKLNHELHDLERQGMISVDRKRIILTDLNALWKLLGKIRSGPMEKIYDL